MNTPKFVPGDLVRKMGTYDVREYEVDIVSPNGEVKLRGVNDWVWAGHLELVLKVKASKYEPWECMCGAESVGSKRHAGPYCPKYTKW